MFKIIVKDDDGEYEKIISPKEVDVYEKGEKNTQGNE